MIQQNSIQAWIQAFRLRTLPLALSSTFLGSFLAADFGRFNWAVFAFATLTTLLLQILSNLANDYGDAEKGTDSEARLGPLRVTQTGLVTPSAMKKMIVAFVVLSLISGVLLIGFGLSQYPFFLSLLFFVLGLSAIVAAIKYTVGQNPYGYMGLGDFFVFIFFGWVGVIGTYFLHTGLFDPWILLPASSIGFFSAGVLNLNNLRDIDNDARFGKQTVAVRFGLNTAKWYHVFLIVIGFGLSLGFMGTIYQSPWQWIFLVTIFPLASGLKTVLTYKNPIELIDELKKLAMTTFIFSLLFGFGLLLS